MKSDQTTDRSMLGPALALFLILILSVENARMLHLNNADRWSIDPFQPILLGLTPAALAYYCMLISIAVAAGSYRRHSEEMVRSFS